jgi:hypothetical protein
MCEVPEFFGDPVIIQNEPDLYVPVETYLYQGFYELHKPRHGNARMVAAQTASLPAAGRGAWTQPDLAAVLVLRGKFTTAAEIRIFSFEVKTLAGCQLQSVHEALAHTRFVNSSYLVWNRPKCTCSDREFYAMVESNCNAYGVGLITVHDPGNLSTFEVRVRAHSKTIPADEADEFILTRFNAHQQNLILGALRRFCPGPL